MKYFRIIIASICYNTLIAGSTYSEVYVLNVNKDLDVVIDGPILAGDDSKFRHIADTYGSKIKSVILNSPGGSVPDGLRIAELIHSLELNTNIPEGDRCLSACFYLFSAGKQRNADGALGVHQMSIPGDNKGDISIIQTYLSRVTRIINNSRIDPVVLDIMLATAPTEIYVFNKDELSTFNIGSAANLDPVLPNLKDDDAPKFLSLLPREFGPEEFHARYRHNDNGKKLEIDCDFSVISERLGEGVIRQTFIFGETSLRNNSYLYSYNNETSPVYKIYYDKFGKIINFELGTENYFAQIDHGLPMEEKILNFLFPVFIVEPFLGVHGWFNDKMPIDDVYQIEKLSDYVDELEKAIVSGASYGLFRSVHGAADADDADLYRFFELFRRYEQFLPSEVATANPLERQKGYLVPFAGTNRVNAFSRADGFQRRTYVTTVSGSINTRTSQIDSFTGSLSVHFDDGTSVFEGMIDINPRE